MRAFMRCRILPALAGMIYVLAGIVASPSATAEEEDTCGTRCWEMYGACYRSTSNRRRCQGKLLRCLNNCIRAKRKGGLRRLGVIPPGAATAPSPGRPMRGNQ